MDESIDTLLAKVARSPSVTPLPPFQGTDRFEVRRRLGHGAFGDVFEARDREFGSRIALKVLKHASPEALFRFKREFRTIADISHPNLVSLYELQQFQGHWVLTMEYVDGIAFDDYLRRGPETLSECFAQLTNAIECLHCAHVLHRDVKPSNILVERSGRVVLLDFGLVKADTSTKSSLVVGTPRYMAPEQRAGYSCRASDWFAFGTMLYEAVGHRSPFPNSENSGRTRLAPPCVAVNSEHQSLANLATRLLSPTPEDRPRSEEIAGLLRTPQPNRRRVQESTFVGRTAELKVIRECLEASKHAPSLVMLMGAPGIGKTHLAKYFLSDAQRQGYRVYEGRCHEAESLPFKGFDALMDMICEDLQDRQDLDLDKILPRNDHAYALATMFPVLKRIHRFAQADTPTGQILSPQELRTTAFQALHAFLGNLAKATPLVLFLDDLQWAKEDSLKLLLSLLQNAMPRMLVITAMRQEDKEKSIALQHFSHGLAAMQNIMTREIFLTGLDIASVEKLVKGAQQTKPVSLASTKQLQRESGGHPLLLLRMLHSGLSTASRDITNVLIEEFAEIDPKAMQILRYICLSAAPLSQLDACRLAELKGWSGKHIDALRHAKLVRTNGIEPTSVIKPYHDRIRDALEAMHEAHEVTTLHGALADYLRTSSLASADAIATHYAGSGQREQTRIWAQRAAHEASKTLAFARAAELYKLAALSCDSDLTISLHRDWARAVATQGRSVEAGKIFLAASRIAKQYGKHDEVSSLLASAGEHLMLGGEFTLGREVIWNALADNGVDIPANQHIAVARALNLGAALAAGGLGFRVQETETFDTQLARLVDIENGAARALGFTDTRAPYLACLSLTHALALGDPRRIQGALCSFVMTNAAMAPSHEVFQEAIDLAFSLAVDEGELGWAHMIRGLTYEYQGKIAQGFPDLREAERIFWRSDPPQVRDASAMRIMIMFCCIGDGIDLPFAIAHCDDWIAEATSRNDIYARNFMQLTSSWMLLAQDKHDLASDRLSVVSEEWAAVEDEMFWSSSRVYRIGIELYRNPKLAFELVQEIEPEFCKRYVSLLPIPNSSFHTLRGHAAAAAYAGGEATLSTTQTRLEDSIEALGRADYWSPAAHGLRGHIAAINGDRRGAARHFQTAATKWGEHTQVVFAHSASLRAAELRDDSSAIRAHSEALQDQGIITPSRYATLFAGPSFHR